MKQRNTRPILGCHRSDCSWRKMAIDNFGFGESFAIKRGCLVPVQVYPNSGESHAQRSWEGTACSGEEKGNAQTARWAKLCAIKLTSLRAPRKALRKTRHWKKNQGKDAVLETCRLPHPRWTLSASQDAFLSCSRVLFSFSARFVPASTRTLEVFVVPSNNKKRLSTTCTIREGCLTRGVVKKLCFISNSRVTSNKMNAKWMNSEFVRISDITLLLSC